MKYSIEEIKNYLHEYRTIDLALDALSDEAMIEANLVHIYKDDVTWQATIKTREEFVKWVSEHGINEFNILAYPAIKVHNIYYANEGIEIELYNLSPTFLNNIPESATHVAWYSK